MEYPTLDPNAKLFKIYEKALSPYYDIVWSFDYYATSIPANSQLGICLFLQDSTGTTQASLLSGGNNIDLGYSGSDGGTDKGLVGVGLDTTGCFALSLSSLGSTIRDGDLDINRKLNSIAVRGQGPSYSWNEYSINRSLSAFNFNILETRKKTIRARLGNVGQTLYVDFRYSPTEDFVNILTQDVTFSRSLSSKFRPGVTISKPVSGTAPKPTIRFSNFTVEGREVFTYVPPTSSVNILESPVINDTCLVTECEFKPYVPPVYEPYVPPPIITAEPATANRQHTAQVSVSLNRGINIGFYDGYASFDLYNFGYSVSMFDNVTTQQTILNRSDYFIYISQDNSITLSLSSFDSTWKLIGPGINYTNNSNALPIGTYSNYTISYI
jgi:hypothetical protein